MRKISILLFILNCLGQVSNAQYHNGLQNKYWFYRYRLINNFLAVPNRATPSYVDSMGFSIPFGKINIHHTYKTGQYPMNIDRFFMDSIFKPNKGILHRMHWAAGGDGTIELGWYIGTLATEYRLLKNAGKTTTDVEWELYAALKAFDRVDNNANKMNWPANDMKGVAALDGFFIRDDQDIPFLIKNFKDIRRNPNGSLALEGNESSTSFLQQYKVTDPAVKSFMSKDQVVGMLLGFALVKKFVDPIYINGDSRQLVQIAQDATERMMRYIENNLDGFKIPGQNAFSIDNGGEKIADMSYLFTKAGEYITGRSYSPKWYSKTMMVSMMMTGGVSITQGYTQAMYYGTAAIGNSIEYFWPTLFTTSIECTAWGWLCYPKISWKPSWTQNNTSSTLWSNACTFYNRRHIYKLLHEVLHGDKSNSIDAGYYTDLLKTAPCEGPSFNAGIYDTKSLSIFPNVKVVDPASTLNYYTGTKGWKAMAIFSRSTSSADYGDPDQLGEFNGLDYMLLHNSYLLNYEPNRMTGTMRADINLDLTRMMNGNPPIVEYKSWGKITSNYYHIGQLTQVKYKAGEEIVFLPGFWANNDMSATIENYDCSLMESSSPARQSYQYPESATQREMQIQEQQLSQMQVNCFPNNFQNQVTIQYVLPTGVQELTITVTDAIGKEIIHTQPTTTPQGAHQVVLSTTDWTVGLYMVYVTSSQYAKTIKIVKQ